MSTGNRKWPAQPERSGDRRGQTARSIANITEDVRKYAAEQGLAAEEALKACLAEKAAEFTEKGAELYARA